MGFVSFREDVLERMISQLDSLQDRATKRLHTVLSGDLKLELNSLARTSQLLKQELESHLELATNPSIDVAHHAAELQRENEALKNELRLLKQQNTELDKKYRRLDEDFNTVASRSAKYRVELEELKHQYKRLSKQLKRDSRRR